MRIAVLCSGKGSNFQAIIDAAKNRVFDGEIAIMVCDNPDAYAIEIAREQEIPYIAIDRRDFPSKEEFEKAITKQLEQVRVDLVCLAGYMRLLSPAFIDAYRNRIINIHPALLPAFKGADGVKDALGYGVKVTGVTVHFVTEDVDAGPIILQSAVEISDNDTEGSLRERIHKTEHVLYPKAIRLFIEGRLKIKGRKVYIINQEASK